MVQLFLLKPKLKLFEETSELKIGWLIGESFRNKSVVVQVVIVALILNIFAVVPAVFMMLVLDKVVNYEAYSTFMLSHQELLLHTYLMEYSVILSLIY